MRALFAAIALSALIIACGGDDGGPGPAGHVLDPLTNPDTITTPTPTPSPEPEVPPLTVAGIFPARDLSSLDLDPSRVRTIIATGDVIPARYTDYTIRNEGDDFVYPVAYTKDLVAGADLSVVNLEAPLVDYCPLTLEGFTFCGRPGFTEALTAAGVDVVTMENNHIGNYGQEGIDATRGYLEAAGMQWVDRYTSRIIEVRGLKFGFLAFNAVGETVDRAAMAAAIQDLDSQVDVLAVAVHWGIEYTSLPYVAPGVADDSPIELAHLAIDSGADLLIGNHPHWVQGVELYKGKYIAYAHGNFIFDQMWSYPTRIGVVGKYTFYDDQLIGVEYTPVRIDNYAQPVILEGQERQDVLDTMRNATNDLAADLAAGYTPTPTPGG